MAREVLQEVRPTKCSDGPAINAALFNPCEAPGLLPQLMVFYSQADLPPDVCLAVT